MDERPPDRGEQEGVLEESILVSVYNRLLGRYVHEQRTRLIIGYSVTAAILILVTALGIASIWLGFNEQKFKGLGYAGIFLINLVSTSTFFFPVPGLTAAGQALIVSEAGRLGPLPVGILGGAGMGLGEITAYVAGALGREVAQGRQMGGPSWFRTAVDKSVRAVNRLLTSHGMLTLFVLSVIPNPVFEVAGLTAGAVRMKFWRFLSAVMAGKILRGLALAYLGAFSFHAFGL